MQDAIQPGDVVKLKSGGMLMTVSKVEERSATVYWALDGEIKWHSINLMVLEKVTL